MEKNQKLLEETMRKERQSEEKNKEVQYKTEEEAEKARGQTDLKYSKKFGFNPLHFNIVEENDLSNIQLKDERYKPGTILDAMDSIDPRSSSEKEDFIKEVGAVGKHWSHVKWSINDI